MTSKRLTTSARTASKRRAVSAVGPSHARARVHRHNEGTDDPHTGLRKRPRQRRAQTTFDAVLEAAAELIAQQGFARTTTNTVAERAGISIGSLYQYFPNKTAILVSLLERHIYEIQPVIAECLTVLADPAMRFEDALRQLFLRLIEAHGHSPRLQQVLSEEVPHPPSIQRLRQKLEGGYVGQVAEILRQRSDVQVANPEVAAHVIVVVSEAVTYWLSHAALRSADNRRYVDEVVRLLGAYSR
jgi:AcrR family transcriptional regulator